MESVVKIVKKPAIQEDSEDGELKEDNEIIEPKKSEDDKTRKRHWDSDDAGDEKVLESKADDEKNQKRSKISDSEDRGRKQMDDKNLRRSDREVNKRRNDDRYLIGRRYWGSEENLKEERDYRRRERREDDRRRDRNDKENEEREVEPQAPAPRRKQEDSILTRTGGAYIPPAKLRMMQAEVTDKNSVAFQRLAWEALKKSIHGLINKVNVSNIESIVKSLIRENLIRGRGLLCRSIIQAQAASPTFTHVYAALVSLINSKFPSIGELLLARLVLQFRRGYRRNDKQSCLSSTRFIAHLVNQQVAHEVLALEILTLLLENATDDSVEVAIGFIKECGQKLGEVAPKSLTGIFDRLRHVLHEAELDKRIKYMIEVMFQIRKDGFKDNPAIPEGLDQVQEEDQITHLVTIEEEELNPQDMLNVFQHDPKYTETEEKYQAVKNEILGSEAEDEIGSDGDGEGDSSESEESDTEEKTDAIVDETETNAIVLRRIIYLTVQSSLDQNECAHKMMKMQLKPGQEIELCHMILDCCAQQRTYEKFFGLLAQRFCQINKIYIGPFEQIFRDTYDTIHRLDTNKLRNVSKMFAHLLFTDAISWSVFSHIRITEQDTTSSSRIFLKILFQELAEYMGLVKLNARLSDPTLQTYFEGIFPRDDPRNTRFAINYFTSIGLGGLTDGLREHLRTHPKPPQVTAAAANQVSSLSAAAAQLLLEESSSSSSSDSSDDESSDSSSSSSSSSSSASSSSSTSNIRRRKKSKEDVIKKPEENEKSLEPSRQKDGFKNRDLTERRSDQDPRREGNDVRRDNSKRDYSRRDDSRRDDSRRDDSRRDDSRRDDSRRDETRREHRRHNDRDRDDRMSRRYSREIDRR